MSQIRSAEQQAEQVLVLRHRDGLFPQQAGHLVEQAHDDVPLPGSFLRCRDAPLGPDGLDEAGLLVFGPQFFEAEIEGPAHLLGIGGAQLAPQGVHGPHQQGTGFLGPGQVGSILLGGFHIAKAPGIFGKLLPPGRRIGGPGIGVIFQRADLFLGQAAQAGLGQGGQLLGELRAPGQSQQGSHGGGRGAELRRGRLIAVEGNVRHPELIPHGGPVLCNVAADHGDLPAADPLPHQAADGSRRCPGFFLPAGGGKQVQPVGRFRGQRFTAACFQQAGHSRQRRGILMAEVFPQQLRHGYFRPVFPGQLAQLCRHLLGPGEQTQIFRLQRGPVIAQGHRYQGQCRQHGPHQPLFGGVERIKFIYKDRPVPQKLRQLSRRQCRFQPVGSQLQPVRRVHAGMGQQRFIPLEDEGQLAEFAALRAAVPGQRIELLSGKARALELVNGLRRHLAERRRAAVAVVIVHIVLQLFQRAADQHCPPGIREGLHRRAALGGEDLLGQAGERKALHQPGEAVPQFPVNTALCGGSKLFRHQQDAALPCLGPGLDALVQQGCLAAAGAA